MCVGRLGYFLDNRVLVVKRNCRYAFSSNDLSLLPLWRLTVQALGEGKTPKVLWGLFTVSLGCLLCMIPIYGGYSFAGGVAVRSVQLFRAFTKIEAASWIFWGGTHCIASILSLVVGGVAVGILCGTPGKAEGGIF